MSDASAGKRPLYNIDLTAKVKDAPRILENAVTMNINPKGTRILYFLGDFGDEPAANLPIAKKARELFDRGLVHLWQKKLSDEPRKYGYIVEIK